MAGATRRFEIVGEARGANCSFEDSYQREIRIHDFTIHRDASRR
jgi:hypothetical protein